MRITIDELRVADPPQAWRDAGFTVDGDVVRVGRVRIRLIGPDAGRGIVGWSLRGLADGVPDLLDGLPTTRSDAPPAEPDDHRNGVLWVDHVVVMSPDLDRTTAAFRGIGLEVRRVRDFDPGGTPMRQVFFRLGEVVLELVGTPEPTGDGPATFWGITHTVADLDATAALLGDRTGRVKDAVQPGRQITTLRHRELGMGVATAFLTRPPHRPG